MSWWNQWKQEKYYVLADQVIVSGSALVTNLLVARALGLAGYGSFAAMGMVQLFLLSLSMAGGSQVYQVLLNQLDREEQASYTNGVFYGQLILAVSVIFFAVIAFLLPLDYLRQYGSEIIWWGIATALYLLQDFLRKALITQRKGKASLQIDLLTNFLQLIVLASFWYRGALTLQLTWLIVGSTFLPSILLGIWWLRPGTPVPASLHYAWSLHKYKSSWLLGTSIIQWSSGYYFVMAAGWWISASALGALRLAQYLFGLLNVLLQAIENYMLPRVSANRLEPKYWWQLMKKCFLYSGPLLLLLVLFARQIGRLAGGPAFTAYSYVMYGLGIVYLLITAGYPIRIAIRSRQLNKEYFTGYVLAVVFSVVFAPWLLTHWQLYGVLVGLGMTQLIVLLYWIYVLNRKIQC